MLSAGMMSNVLLMVFLLLELPGKPILSYGNLNCSSETAIRLVDGAIETEGRLEVCYNGQWGTVCDVNFWIADGKVACNQLGFANDVVMVYEDAYFGEGEGSVAITKVKCTGDEANIFVCAFSMNFNCEPSNNVGISCLGISAAECDDGSVRLFNSTVETEGRLEVCYNGQWGTVCDDSFDLYDGRLVCKQLGFVDIIQIFEPPMKGTGNIWIDLVQCSSGSETSIFDCAINLGGGMSICDHKEDVGINCSNVTTTTTTTTTTISSSTSSAISTINSVDTNVISLISQTATISNSTVFQTTTSMTNTMLSSQYLSSQTSVQVPTSLTTVPSQNASSIIIPIVTASAAFAFLLIVVVSFFIICFIRIKIKKRKYKRHSVRNLNLLETSMNSAVDAHLSRKESLVRYIEMGDHRKRNDFLKSCLIDSTDLKLIEKIGQGEFGIVYRGVLTMNHKKQTSLVSVAVKTLKGNYSELEIQQLLNEAEKMKHFDHINVLTLTGICLGIHDSPCIVMPFMSNGSLLSYLRKEAADLTISELADESIVFDTTKQLLSMCLQVAKGMTYLTEHKFVHRDLAARNCMISSDSVIKVADFGLAEEITNTTEYFKLDKDSDEPVKLPVKWMALESIHFGKFSEKTDVWSYGVLCWEVFTLGRSPYPGIDPIQLVRILDLGERLDKPSNPACTEEMYSLIVSCWNMPPDERPSFIEIVSMMDSMMAPLADYLDFSLSTIMDETVS